jgi:hypothetical protein
MLFTSEGDSRTVAYSNTPRTARQATLPEDTGDTISGSSPRAHATATISSTQDVCCAHPGEGKPDHQDDAYNIRSLTIGLNEKVWRRPG